MFRRIVLLCCFFGAPIVWAKRLEVTFKETRYALDYDQQKISLHGNLYRLNLVRTKCNQRIIDQFNRNLEKSLKGIPRPKDLKTPWSYRIDGKKVKSDYKSEEAKVLLLIPQEIHRLKLQNKYLCGRS